MAVSYLLGKGKFYQFPFWASAIALGWFVPQAIGGYLHIEQFPDGAYTRGMFFATICTLALWRGYAWASNRETSSPTVLDADFYNDRLFVVGAVLCTLGFYFQWKLKNLPDEMLAETQWSGATVKYYFLASIGRYGFITLWLLYLSQSKWFSPKYLIFLLPNLQLLLEAAILQGRRAAMMDLVSYVAVSLWLIKRVSIPRWVIVAGLAMGLLLINAIGIYRSIMSEEHLTLEQKLSRLMQVDYAESTLQVDKSADHEFKNYIFYRQTYGDDFRFDYGLVHWNGVVFNYVPAQIVGSKTKKALMVSLYDPIETARVRYGHEFHTGTTVTGYCDAFGSFGWLGFIKFLWIGALMGILYRHAMSGAFLAQLLYVMLLGTAMHAVSHGTNRIMVSSWVYFLALCYPFLLLAKVRKPVSMDMNV